LDIPYRRTKAGLESTGDLVATSTTKNPEAIIALIVILILLMMGLSPCFGIIPSQLATSISVLAMSLIFIGGTV
jgi:hypothetical protein